jgi:hypothetical protein
VKHAPIPAEDEELAHKIIGAAIEVHRISTSPYSRMVSSAWSGDRDEALSPERAQKAFVRRSATSFVTFVLFVANVSAGPQKELSHKDHQEHKDAKGHAVNDALWR